MAVTSHVSADGNQLTIAIKGRFDFAKHQDFDTRFRKQALLLTVGNMRQAIYRCNKTCA